MLFFYIIHVGERMVFNIKLAEKIIEIHARYDLVYRKCTNYLVNQDAEDTFLVISVSNDEMLYEEAEMQEDIWRLNGMYFSRDPQLLEYVVIQRKIANAFFRDNTLVMHGAVVSCDNMGLMFTGHSGIGKSTRARIWLQEYPSSIVINGDKPFIRITDQDIYAYGSPWCGKEGWNTNTCVPLRTVFLLERTDEEYGEESSLTKLTLSEALPTLLQQTYKPSNLETIKRTIQLFKLMDAKVNFYRFKSTLSREAIRLAYETVGQSLKE